MNINLKRVYEETAFRTCCVENEKIVDYYLLSEEELDYVKKIIPIFNKLPEDFDVGILEINKEKYCIIKSGDRALIAISNFNISEIQEKISKIKVILNGR